MAYSKQTWVRGEKVASTKLNHMEDGIDAISANGAIDTDNLANASVTNAKLADGAVDTSNIANGAVGTTEIQDGAVTRAKLADAALSDIAAEYSSSSTYAVGDYVFHSGAMYRCISAITTAEAWTAAHWTQVALGDDVADIKSEITQLDKTYTSTLPFTLVANEYVVNNTGAFASYGGWSRTDYVDLSSVIDFTPNILSNYSAFYDAEKRYLKDVKFTENQTVIVPNDAAYIVISGTTVGMNALVVSCTKNGVVKETQNHVDDIENLINSETFIYPTEIIPNAYINKDGTLTTGTDDFVATPFLLLPFNENQSFQLHTSIYGLAGFAIYDKNKELLLGIDTTNMSTYGGVSTGEIQTLTIPYIDGMMYARLSCRTVKYTALTDIWCKGNPLAGAFRRIVNIETELNAVEGNISTTIAYSKVLVIGDSISADAYGSYKKWVTDLNESGFFPADTVNNSQHATGFVARYDNQPNDFITRIKAIENPSQYDLVVVFGGINDYIQNVPMGSESGTDYTVSFKPAVNEFFGYLIQNFTQARLCVLLPLRTYATWQNSVDEYQQAYSDYIKTVAKSYCLPILNLTEESGFCPYISTFSNMWTLEVEGSHDGVHPNEEYERRFLAPMIKKFLQGLM